LENPNISKEEAEKIVIDTYNKVKMENW
jgi:hypothetical protein